jgi:spore maturation protein CgeB
MRIVIFDTYYPEALKLVYQNDPGLEDRSYAEQIRAVYELGFARSDFLPLNLYRLGHEANQFIANAEPLQRRWALEHGLRLSQSSNDSPIKKLWNRGYQSLRWRVGLTPNGEVEKWHMEAVAAQVKAYDPDVIFVCNVLHLPAEFFETLKDSGRRLLVGEIAYPIPAELNLRPYDLLVSAAPNFVSRLRQAGAKAEFLPLAFEPSVLKRLNSEPKAEGLVFIGTISGHHQERIRLLEEVSRHAPLSCYGAGVETLAPDSPLRRIVQPPIWGYEMYRKLQQSQIALNIHIDIAEKYAANMRLYEATGVGTMLLTDWKENLNDLFEVGKEVMAYRTPEECAELVEYYVDHPAERETIAAAGQRRTLRDHTYEERMRELTTILQRHLRR